LTLDRPESPRWAHGPRPRRPAQGTEQALLPIGRFARLVGLLIGALRHYDELDLLRPADVGPLTGYRRYRAAQVETALAIRRLGDLELPIEDIRAVLATADPAERHRLLAGHRSRIEARANRLHLVMHHLGELSSGKDRLVAEPDTTNQLIEQDLATLPL
jgi:DNA-binding transcriptional MerR regulator